MQLESASQCGQDLWAAICQQGARGLRYLDVGAGDPRVISNTWMLEKSLGWSGYLIDVKTAPRLAAERAGNCVLSDALEVDWREIALSGRFDYLSLDLEPAEVTLRALLRMLEAGVEFSCATIEHDSYRFGPDISRAMRAILSARGYVCVLEDAVCKTSEGFVPLEDWWVDPNFINPTMARSIAWKIQSDYVEAVKP